MRSKEGAYGMTTERFRERRIRCCNTQTSAFLPRDLWDQARTFRLVGYPSAPVQSNSILSSLNAPPRGKNTNLVVFPDLTNYRVECLVNVDGLLGGCFHEDASEVFCQITTLYDIIIDQPVCISNTVKRNGVGNTRRETEGIPPSGHMQGHRARKRTQTLEYSPFMPT
jgi:hypothetical protein